jgi:hypothetical protein
MAGSGGNCVRAKRRLHVFAAQRCGPVGADEKTAGFLVDDALQVMSEYRGDLNALREKAAEDPAQVGGHVT